MKKIEFWVESETEMEQLGKNLSHALNLSTVTQGVMYLKGPLGAGKTTLTRGFLRGLGYQDTVKSPTFTLVEPYEFSNYTVYHFDFYRLNSPLELEGMGIRDYFTPGTWCILEWPEKGAGICPGADIEITIDITASPSQRQVHIVALTPSCLNIVENLKKLKN